MNDITTKIQPVVMAGGSGTRLWPLSRAMYPKQFLALTGTDTLLQLAAMRLGKIPSAFGKPLEPIVVSNEEHRFLVQEQLREIGIHEPRIILEPAGRNTAPALTLAALAATANGEDPILVVTPADQTVQNEPAFAQAIASAAGEAAGGKIVILGIQPTGPETGFGYIHAEGQDAARNVRAFIEKPDRVTAESLLSQGQHFWNGGIFILKASVWLHALEKFRPDIRQACNLAWAGRKADGLFDRPAKAEFLEIPSESIDYAVMEKCPGSDQQLVMVPLHAGWSDLGAWEAVWQVAAKDGHGNATSGDALLVDTSNSLVRADGRLVCVVGLEDVVVVETADAVLVSHRGRAQDVKKIVNALNTSGRTEHHQHRRVGRPWGWYDSIDSGERFQVKRILVNPGASLSLQMHHHRAEHWIVVSGTAEVTVGEKTVLLSENQSTYIPLGQTHRLRNPGKLPLELIEVQSGGYLGEDDIVRFEDHYGRS